MLLSEDANFVVLAGALLAAVCALVLLWRAAARGKSAPENEMRAQSSDVRSAQIHQIQERERATAAVQPAARGEPAAASGLSYTAIAVAAAEAARTAVPREPARPASATAAMPTGDDPYGVRATLPAGASYTEIAVATAEAARRAQAGVRFEARG